ncbi:MAG: cyclic lactone autoinducer peptide [Ruminococcus sp.]|nr:cyclic lactone autoinducer peptide [Ruminococcus sp.]
MSKDKIYKLIAAFGRKAAINASGTASGFGTYQPKEPSALKKLKK